MHQDFIVPLLRIDSSTSPDSTFRPSLLIIQFLHLIVAEHHVFRVERSEDAGQSIGQSDVQSMAAGLEDERVEGDGGARGGC